LQRLHARLEATQEMLDRQRAIGVDHKGARVAPDLDLAHALQRAQRLAHRDPADRQLFG